MKSKKGFSLVEVMVGVAVLGVLAYNFVGSTSFLSSRNKQIEELMIMERHVNNLYENIQGNIDIYQITYNPEDFFANSDPSKLNDYLPLAWDLKILTDKSSCPSCPGRLGYVIVPLDSYRGLYKLTIRVTHPKLQSFKDYNFLINGK